MIETVIIDSIDKVMKMISEQTFNTEIGRLRSVYYFRGMPDVSYELTTSLRHNCKGLSKQLEPSILRSFTKYASIEHPTMSNSVWQQMMVGQHHGLPTRLLDWTYSPLIALHFANAGIDFDEISQCDSVVWRFNVKDSNNNLPEKYKKILQKDKTNIFSVDSLHSVVDSIEQYDLDMRGTSMVNIEPPSVDQRIVNQYSFFSIIPSGMENIEEYFDKYTLHTVKYIIKKEIRWNVRDLLDQFNISERIIYPGLDGLSKMLARHYYVK